MSWARTAIRTIGRRNQAEKVPRLGQSKRLPDRSASELRNREEIVVYQQNALTIVRGKSTIFELTHIVKAASCRLYPEKLSGL
jgi:hypothetical protein